MYQMVKPDIDMKYENIRINLNKYHTESKFKKSNNIKMSHQISQSKY